MIRHLSLVVALVIAGAACTGKPKEAPLRIQLWGEPVSLDPALAEDLLSLQLLENTTEGLVGYDGAGNLENRLAESYELSADGLRLTFRLRQTAAWSDGRPVTAEQIVDGIRRALSPDIPAKMAVVLEPIRGAKAFRKKEMGVESLGVKVVDGKVVIELEKPTPYFIHALTLGVAAPIRLDLYAGNQGKWSEKFAVNGPYRVIEHKVDEKFVLERNPFYWKKDGYRGLPRIEYLVVREDGTALNLFEQGKLDILTKIAPLDIIRLKQTHSIRTSPFFATYFLGFNLKKPPFDNRDLRRAVVAAIRKDEIVAALGTEDVPARSFITMGLEGFQPYLKENPEFAHALDSFKRHHLAIPKDGVIAQYDANARNSLVLEKIQQDLISTLGLRIGLLPLDWKSHIKTMQTDPSPIFRFGWLTPFNDPIFFLEPGVTGDRSNYGGFSNARFDQLVEQIRRLKPGAEREKKIIEAQKIWVEDEAAIVPLYHYTQAHAVSKRVKGYRVNPFGYLVLPELGLEEPEKNQ